MKSVNGRANVTVGIRPKQALEAPMVLSRCRRTITGDAKSGLLRGSRCCCLGSFLFR